MSKQPNFILYITDQHRADYLGCYGHPVLKTPNIDKLASTGTRFENFYVASPVCMPNRASLMTARMPSSHNVRSNGVPLDKRHVTFVELLQAAGYKTALIGKSHLQNFTDFEAVEKSPAPREGYFAAEGALREAERHELKGAGYKFEEPDFWSAEQPKLPTPFYGFDHVELVTGHGDHCGGEYRQWLLERCPDAAELIGESNQLPHDYVCPQAVRTAIKEEHYSTAYIAERAEAWIAENADGDQPFFLMVSWPDPHHPFNPPGKYWDMYRPEDMPLPAAFGRNDWAPPPHVGAVQNARETGKANLKGMNAIGCNAREAQEARALTCGMITMIDDAVGRVESALEKTRANSRIVKIFTSDHGDHLGDHRLLFKGPEQYEQLTHVPFIWNDPAAKQEGVNKRICQTHDIGPSILERAKIEPAWGMQGMDIFGEERREAAYIQFVHQYEMGETGVTPHIHSLRTPRYRFSLFGDLSWGELYDLEGDPGEFENLWDHEGHKAIKCQLMEALARAQMKHLNRSPMPTRRA